MTYSRAFSTRRGFVLGSIGATLASIEAIAATNAVRLGGPIFLKSEDPVELAKEHRKWGYSAAYCPSVEVEDSEKVRSIEKAFSAEGVVIAEVGAWVNMLDPDAEERRKNIEYVKRRLALADDVGALNCVDIAGSYNPTVWYGPHPKNLSEEFLEGTVENCRKIIDAVRPKRTKFTLEIMGWTLPNGPESYLRLIKAIERPAFAVHMDVCNGINSPERFYENGRFISECFSKLGPWVQSCHAKDLEWKPEMNIHFVEVIPGRGALEYGIYLREIAKLPQRPPLMLEHLKDAGEYREGRDYIVKTGKEVGIDVG
jgi:sugar phosphate isomerase/epimerase